MLWKQLLLLNGYLETAIKWKLDRQQQMPYQSTTVLLPSSQSVLVRCICHLYHDCIQWKTFNMNDGDQLNVLAEFSVKWINNGTK